MKRVFIASSTSLIIERNRISGIFLRLNNEIGRCEYKTFMCETASDAISSNGKQEEYNEIIRKSDYFIVLIKGVIGKYTREEIYTAINAKRSYKRPKILGIIIDNYDKTDSETKRAIDAIKVDGVIPALEASDWQSIEKLLLEFCLDD